MSDDIKIISFDADDTLWANESYFRESEDRFCTLLGARLSKSEIEKKLLEVEINNLPLLGYGVKAFVISMIETAIEITENIDSALLSNIINIGKEQLQKPVVLIDGVVEVLESLKGKYRLVMTTKGDLLEQQNKLRKSGLENYFHHIEILSEKNEAEYRKLVKHLDINPSEFLMIGNSVKSDILPVLDIGGRAIHIPYHTTWEHEKVNEEIKHKYFNKLENITQVIDLLI